VNVHWNDATPSPAKSVTAAFTLTTYVVFEDRLFVGVNVALRPSTATTIAPAIAFPPLTVTLNVDDVIVCALMLLLNWTCTVVFVPTPAAPAFGTTELTCGCEKSSVAPVTNVVVTGAITFTPLRSATP